MLGITSTPLILVFALAASLGFSQTPRLEKDLWELPRARALGFSLAPIANGLASYSYNPAGSGYKDSSSYKPPALSRINLPYVGFSSLAASKTLVSDMAAGSSFKDQSFADRVLQSGSNHYARISLVPNFQYERLSAAYFYDKSFTSQLSGEDEIAFQQYTRSGLATSFSLTDPDEQFALGFSLAQASLEISSATASIAELDSQAFRKESLTSNKKNYKALPVNVGIITKLPLRKWNPRLSLNIDNLSNSRYQSSDAITQDIVIKETIDLGISFKPEFESWLRMAASLNFADISQSKEQLRDKINIGVELSFFRGYGEDSPLALQVSYGNDGVCGGIALQFSVFQLQMASYVEAIEITDVRVVERRNSASFAINAAAF